jgi:hypothetical protein
MKFSNLLNLQNKEFYVKNKEFYVKNILLIYL